MQSVKEIKKNKITILASDKSIADRFASKGYTIEHFDELNEILAHNGLVDSEKLSHYMDKCPGLLLITKEYPEQWEEFSHEGAVVMASFETDMSASLDEISADYIYRTVHGGETGCFVVMPHSCT